MLADHRKTTKSGQALDKGFIQGGSDPVCTRVGAQCCCGMFVRLLQMYRESDQQLYMWTSDTVDDGKVDKVPVKVAVDIVVQAVIASSNVVFPLAEVVQPCLVIIGCECSPKLTCNTEPNGSHTKGMAGRCDWTCNLG